MSWYNYTLSDEFLEDALKFIKEHINLLEIDLKELEDFQDELRE